MSGGVAIVGAAESDLGVTNSSILGLQTQAVTRALADAGLTLATSTASPPPASPGSPPPSSPTTSGIQPRWTDSTFAGGSAFEMFVGPRGSGDQGRAGRGRGHLVRVQPALGAVPLAGGRGGEPHSRRRSSRRRTRPLYPLSYYAMAAQRYLHDYGETRAQLAEIAVAAREWALLNPKAYRYGAGPLTVDDVLNSPHGLQPADRRRLLPGHRRRRRGRADHRRTRPRPARQARSRCSATARRRPTRR